MEIVGAPDPSLRDTSFEVDFATNIVLPEAVREFEESIFREEALFWVVYEALKEFDLLCLKDEQLLSNFRYEPAMMQLPDENNPIFYVLKIVPIHEEESTRYIEIAMAEPERNNSRVVARDLEKRLGQINNSMKASFDPEEVKDCFLKCLVGLVKRVEESSSMKCRFTRDGKIKLVTSDQVVD